MRAIELKVIETDLVRDRRTKLTDGLGGMRTDSELYDPTRQEPCPFFYRDHFRMLLNAPMDPRAGVTPEEWALSVAVLKKLKKLSHGATLYLEEDEWKHLVAKVDRVPLVFCELWIDECHQDVRHAPQISDDELNAALHNHVASNLRELVRS